MSAAADGNITRAAAVDEPLSWRRRAAASHVPWRRAGRGCGCGERRHHTCRGCGRAVAAAAAAVAAAGGRSTRFATAAVAAAAVAEALVATRRWCLFPSRSWQSPELFATARAFACRCDRACSRMADSDDSVLVPEVFVANDIEGQFIDADALLGTSDKGMSAGGLRVSGAPPAILAKNAAVEASEVEVDELLRASYDASRPVFLQD